MGREDDPLPEASDAGLLGVRGWRPPSRAAHLSAARRDRRARWPQRHPGSCRSGPRGVLKASSSGRRSAPLRTCTAGVTTSAVSLCSMSTSPNGSRRERLPRSQAPHRRPESISPSASSRRSMSACTSLGSRALPGPCCTNAQRESEPVCLLEPHHRGNRFDFVFPGLLGPGDSLAQRVQPLGIVISESIPTFGELLSRVVRGCPIHDIPLSIQESMSWSLISPR